MKSYLNETKVVNKWSIVTVGFRIEHKTEQTR